MIVVGLVYLLSCTFLCILFCCCQTSLVVIIYVYFYLPIDVYNHNAVLEYGTIPHITLCSPAMISSLFDVKLLDNYLFQTQSASNQKKVKGHVQLLNAMQYMIFNDKISHVVLDEVC